MSQTPVSMEEVPVYARPVRMNVPGRGGLLALAIINFAFGGLGMIIYWGGFALATETGLLQGVIQVTLGLRSLEVVLLIVSGIGYLGCRNILGRIVGSAYAVVAMFTTLYAAAFLYHNFGFLTVIWMMYPVVTLILLNTTFVPAFELARAQRPVAPEQIRRARNIGMFPALAAIAVAAAVSVFLLVGQNRVYSVSQVETAVSKKLQTDSSEIAAYARNITFDKMTLKRSRDGYRWEMVARNAGDKTVAHLSVNIALIDADGVQVAGDTDLLAHGFILGENNTPMQPRGAKRVGGEIETSASWTSGKAIVTIEDLRLE
ncbi:MAG: hypothetical protein ABFD92_16250 [Planctomycetaceae bacterium]|nr:hypothetical protein [Planctomycetaceae bacterium]